MEIEKTSRQMVSAITKKNTNDSDQFLGPHGPRYGLCTNYIEVRGTVVHIATAMKLASLTTQHSRQSF